ncbi:MAG: hypothetical protein IKN74_04730 [Clostridia bacterium]|nr:hypothetical protein [Clostridia bacterium]
MAEKINYEKEPIKLEIFGKERNITLEELIEIYKGIGDPSPERNARASFRIHQIAQERAKVLEKAKSSPEAMIDFVMGEVKHAYFGYEYGLDYDVSPIPEDVYELSKELPLKDLERVMNYCSDERHIERFQQIIDEKKKQEEQEQSPNNDQNSSQDKDDDITHSDR